jgi:ABC-type bacteriocin/lantibiotic exporter with double-glycine peptidase domain
VAAELIVTSVLYSISKMGKQFEAFYDIVAGLNKIDGILQLPVEAVDGKKVERSEGAWSLSLRDVVVSAADGARRLHQLNLERPKGSRVLVHGRSGSGKSLLAGLLSGSIRPESGQVLFQEQDLRYLAPKELKNRIRLVGELELIDGTVEENLGLGNAEVSLPEMERALEAVKLNQLVSELPEGLLSRMTARGAPLTYAQARKLMLARAILARPGLLILDKNSDWIQGTGSVAPELLGSVFSALQDCTVVVLAESEFATDDVRQAFDLRLILSEGVLHHE